jgi:hypothetical protein
VVLVFVVGGWGGWGVDLAGSLLLLASVVSAAVLIVVCVLVPMAAWVAELPMSGASPLVAAAAPMLARHSTQPTRQCVACMATPAGDA